MEILYQIIDIFTILISLYIIVNNMKKISLSSRYVIYYVFVIVFVVPLFLDYLVGVPQYMLTTATSRMNGFILSVEDPATRILYDIFLILSQSILTFWNKKVQLSNVSHNKVRSDAIDNSNVSKGSYEVSKEFFGVTAFFMLAAPIVTLLAGYTGIVFTYGWRDMGLFSVKEMGLYSICEKLSYLGVVSSMCLLLANQKQKTYKGIFWNIAALLCLVMNICIESKRSILIFALVAYIIIYICNKGTELKLFRILSIACIAVIGVVWLTVSVKTQYRGYQGFEMLYTTLRVDIFRDDTVKAAIYSWLNRDSYKILSYPFQSYIMQIRFIFPLDILSGIGMINIPGIGYNTYFTSALAGVDVSQGQNYMTVSMFDEVISNFSFLGFFIGPMLCVKMSRYIDRIIGYERIIWLCAVVLMMMYSLNYIMYFIQGAVLFTLSRKVRIIWRRN